ncbi:hypothetical protein [Streptomyces hirsutus]|uniref:hypothetical protein n=1 Tax=Streptomyces hirsutus TaxID=35620 RepID=UPI00339F77DE
MAQQQRITQDSQRPVRRHGYVYLASLGLWGELGCHEPGRGRQVHGLGLLQAAVAAGEQQQCGDQLLGLAVAGEKVLAYFGEAVGEGVGEADLQAGALDR